jgi:hypothetical protein
VIGAMAGESLAWHRVQPAPCGYDSVPSRVEARRVIADFRLTAP